MLSSQEYADVNRTYHDVAETLSNYPSLSPRTDVYSTCQFPTARSSPARETRLQH